MDSSEPEVSEMSSLFERLVMNRDISLFLPSLSGFTNSSPEHDPDREARSTPQRSRERIILINPVTQGVVVIEGTSSLESLLRGTGGKNGQPQASKESIEGMPKLEIGEGEAGECVICLEEWEMGQVAKQMPCKHKFHENCIDKWLKIHGSCPVCRHLMPVEEKELGNKRGVEEGERRRGQFWIIFSVGGTRNEESPSNDYSGGNEGAL